MIGSALPLYDTIIVSLLNQIDLLLHNFVFNGYSALASFLAVPVGIAASIAIVIFGIAIMFGFVEMKVSEFAKLVLKIGLTFTAVTKWSFVSEYFIGLVNAGIGGMGDALISASPIHIPGADGMDGALQIVLIQFTKLGSTLFNTGGLSNFGGFFDGMLIWGFGYILVGISLFEIILAKIMLAVLFVFTPLMGMFYLFKPLNPIFDRWLGAIIGFALLQLFVTATLGLALSLVYWWLGVHVAQAALQIGNFGTLPVVIIGILCIGLIFKAASLAQNLGGVVSSASGAAMIGGMIGGAAGASSSGLKGMRGAAGTMAQSGQNIAAGSGSSSTPSSGSGSGSASMASPSNAVASSNPVANQIRTDLREGE